jgi:hypothetical protein
MGLVRDHEYIKEDEGDWTEDHAEACILIDELTIQAAQLGDSNE